MYTIKIRKDMKIPFDIKHRPQIESGEYKVVTGDDRPVRIISWDKKAYVGRYEIVALVPTLQGDTETVQLYCRDGTFIASAWNEKFKLFIVTPEPELTEFEKAVGLEIFDEPFDEEHIKVIKEESAKLLDLARKEIMDGRSKGLRDTQDVSRKAYNDGYKLGLEKGKAEDLKDLPRWKKRGKRNNYSSEVKFAINGRYLEMNNILNDVYTIELLDLIKLPGLKED
jgi:hypothetical protein